MNQEPKTDGPAGIALEVAQLFTEAIAEAEAGFRPTAVHLASARRITAELATIRQEGKTFTLANATDYPALLRFLFRTYAAFQNAPVAAEPTTETPS